MTELTLKAFLVGIFSGGGTFFALKWLFNEVVKFGVQLTSAQKRLGAYVASFVISLSALALAVYLGYAVLVPDTVFIAFATAFLASQAFHASELDKPPA